MANIICVCEDYPSTRLLVVDLLESEGFRVAAFPNGDSAFAYLERHAEDVGLLWTDLRMPGRLDGIALAHEVAERWPWIRIVVASGAEEDAARVPAGARFLLKPWRAADLLGHARSDPRLVPETKARP